MQLVDDRAKAMVDQGIRYQHKGQLQHAAENYKAAISIEHNYVDPHHFLANTYGQLGQFEDAFKEYRIALSLAQKYLPKTIRKRGIEQIMHNLSLTLTSRSTCQQSYHRSAQDFVEICSVLKRIPAFYHAILGQIYSNDLGLGKKAIREFKKFLSKDKDGEITDLIRAKIVEIQSQEAGKISGKHSASPVQRKKRWWHFWKSEPAIIKSQEQLNDEAVREEFKPRTFDGKTRKCINCNVAIPEGALQCSACGSSRFIWE